MHSHDCQINWNRFQVDLKVSCEHEDIIIKHYHQMQEHTYASESKHRYCLERLTESDIAVNYKLIEHMPKYGCINLHIYIYKHGHLEPIM